MFQKAAGLAAPTNANAIDLAKLEDADPFGLPGQKSSIEQHTIVYDAFAESLEGVFFWVHDWMEQRSGWKVTKLVDNLSATIASGLFGDVSRQTRSVQEDMVHTRSAAQHLTKSIPPLVEKLKRARQQIQWFENAASSDAVKKETVMKALKQMMERSSGRTGDLADWVKGTEPELREQFDADRAELRSQVDLLKLYGRWLASHLKGMTPVSSRRASTLVSGFNTAILQVVLLGESESTVEEDIARGAVPKWFRTASQRTFAPVVIVEMTFRAASERIAQGSYTYRGRVEITFTSYGLSGEELSALAVEMEQAELGEALAAVDVGSHLSRLQNDIDELLAPVEGKRIGADEDVNPFMALFSAFQWLFHRAKPAPMNRDHRQDGLPADSAMEQVMRSQAIIKARKNCLKLFEEFKATHKMPVFPGRN